MAIVVLVSYLTQLQRFYSDAGITDPTLYLIFIRPYILLTASLAWELYRRSLVLLETIPVTPATMSGRTLSLFCLVRGDMPPSERVFIVEIAETAQVATLKERIYDKNKPALSDLTDHSLTLWKVSFAVS